MLLIATLPVDAPVWYLVLVGFIFGFGLGNVIAPSTTRMTLATPPARSGSGSAVQNTVRQVASALGVAIISSIVATVYSSQITPVLEDSALPSDLVPVASDSIGGTFEVAGSLAASGQAPADAVAALQQAGIDAFMPALHVAGFLGLALLLVALAVFLLFLPAKAEAVSWQGSHGAPGDEAKDAAHSVHVVDEHGDGLEHVDEAPLELPEGASVEGTATTTDALGSAAPDKA
jgi:MFS transporter, DHA2 family, multidrug resistance protein